MGMLLAQTTSLWHRRSGDIRDNRDDRLATRTLPPSDCLICCRQPSAPPGGEQGSGLVRRRRVGPPVPYSISSFCKEANSRRCNSAFLRSASAFDSHVCLGFSVSAAAARRSYLSAKLTQRLMMRVWNCARVSTRLYAMLPNALLTAPLLVHVQLRASYG